MTAELPRRAWVEQIMGLPVSVHLRGPGAGDPAAAAAVARVFADLRRDDAAFSPYLDGSDLSRWERGEAPPTPALDAVFALCDEARERTGGWFDPRGLPDPRTGRPRYDPSGLVKGWAVQRAAAHLPAGLGWCLNAGGDVLVHAPDGQPPWRIGVEDPDAPEAGVAHVVTRSTGAVATSGRTHRGDHIVDPYTGGPATGVRAVTVTGPDLLWADVYATAAAARGPWAMDWLEGLDGYEALMVTASGLVRVTEGWPAG
ncbi:FAD:protein FMN transferase [Dactylosporangium sp. NPDC000521]|uniref:FAD:protein FMN transferase n=1 Tax=Dactylosporangium sp. NPDC000521 TaxID=3363975 RepID=UPI00369FA793